MKQYRWNLATLGAGLAFIIYMVTLTRVHTYDAYSYAMTVQSKTLAETLHPHHLLYGPLGKLAYAIAQGLGYRGSAFLPLQILNALSGSLGIMSIILLLYKSTSQPFLALLGSGLVGFSFAWWRYAIEVEVYTVATLFLILATIVALRLYQNPHQWRDWVLLGLLHACAILFHQTNMLWAVVVMCVWWYARWDTHKRSERLPFIAAYMAVAAGLTIACYGVAMYQLSDFDSWDEAQNWFFDYATTGFWGGVPSLTTLKNIVIGWSNTWLPNGGWGLMILLLGIILGTWRKLWVTYRPHMIIGLSWLVPYVLFFGWWEADNIEFWIACIPPISMLVILGLSTLPQRTHRLLYGTMSLILATLVFVNGWWLHSHGSRVNDQDRATVELLGQAGAPGDLYLVPNGLQSLYLINEYQRPNTLPLSLDTGNWQQACETMYASIEQTLSAGYTAWIDSEVSSPPTALLERYQLNEGQVSDCFKPFDQAPLQEIGAAKYRVLMPLPDQQPAWNWNGWSNGWLLVDSEQTRWQPNGWQMTPANDLHMVSPPMKLQAKDWSTLEVRLATSIPQSSAQFFWVPPNATATQEASVHWELISDGQMHTYKLDLASHPQWRGTIERLRLDPVQQGLEPVIVQQLRLVP